MIRQRWGTFSVIDAVNPANLVPEVLLYDKLVLPVPKTAEDRFRWHQEGWEPESQEKYLKTLGELAVLAWWGKEQEVEWAQQYENLKQDLQGVVEESKNGLQYQATRMVLAQKRYPLPKGVDEIETITAFQSEGGFQAFFQPDAAMATEELGIKLRQRIALPQAGKFPLGTLATVVALSGENEFVEKRTRVYEKQDQILSNPAPSFEDVQELEQLSDELANYVGLMLSDISYTDAFAVAAVPPGYTSGHPFSTRTAKSVTLSPIRLKANLPVLAQRAGSVPSKAVYHN